MILILEPASLAKHDATSLLFVTWDHKKKHDRYKRKELVRSSQSDAETGDVSVLLISQYRNKEHFNIIAGDIFKIVKKMEKYRIAKRKDNFGKAKEIDNVLNSKIAGLYMKICSNYYGY